VDAVFDAGFSGHHLPRQKLEEAGVIFCPISKSRAPLS
jgi:hypothetical protein